MVDTPPPLPAPLKEGDDGPPPLPAPLKEGDDGPPPLSAPLKEGDDGPPPLPVPLEDDDGPPLAIYALCGPATDDRDVGVATGCGYPLGPTTTYEVGGVLLIKQHSWIWVGCSPNTTPISLKGGVWI